ncbi:solute carrier family 22 member 4-like [Thunnus maccoyii]|uniref:solute carrier family 22 member 4-like n=1 Tax=Thunnus maccoyii TaxID=8240 RepID=UPI001C4BAD09|nr:solute carrier family 22 member 4-like [Thunnus maccoyii]
MDVCRHGVLWSLSLNTSDLNGNAYLNCFISAAIDIVVYVATWLLVNRAPRPTLLFSTLMFCGITLLIIKLVPEGVYSTALPYIIFGTISIMAAVVSMWLPDTRNNKLPDLISQAKPIRGCCYPKEIPATQSDTTGGCKEMSKSAIC